MLAETMTEKVEFVQRKKSPTVEGWYIRDWTTCHTELFQTTAK
jgi:hypothetical protein